MGYVVMNKCIYETIEPFAELDRIILKCMEDGRSKITVRTIKRGEWVTLIAAVNMDVSDVILWY